MPRRRASAEQQQPVERVQRTRKQPAVYSPMAAPVKHRARRVAKPVAGAAAGNISDSRSAQELQLSANTTDEEVPTDEPVHKTLEKRIVAQVKRLRFHLAYLEAYEGEGWRKASREKLKPSQELATARRKLLAGKRAVVDALAELQNLHAGHTQYPYLAGGGIAELLPEDIYCSRCGSTEADEDNDILICDNDGCQRAYHQKCQTPWLATSEIPVGDELWYCEVCLALFNSLKATNYAFGTTYEQPSEVFPELVEEEQEEAQAANGAVAEDDDDEDDDDFVAEDDDDDSDSGDVSSAEEDDESTLRAETRAVDAHAQLDGDASEAEISDQELQYLRKSNVINANSRSTRSRATKQQSAVSFLGQKAAKVAPDTGDVVFGVVVDEVVVGNESGDAPLSESQWQVVYYNDTMEMLTRTEVEAAIACAQKRTSAMAAASLDEHDDAHDVKLILHGKRKRTQVDYRELNAAMFAGKEDSDDEAYADDEHDEQQRQQDLADDAAYQDNDDNYIPRWKKKQPAAKSSTQQPDDDPPGAAAEEGGNGRSRRQRKRVDYNALNEGLVGC